MKATGQEPDQLAKPNEVKTISERKRRANRRNAEKSTGPKTPRGKAYSRRNALKHGLFATDLFPDFLSRRENPKEYQELSEQLRHCYRSAGFAEQLEVDRIAQCMWRLKRAGRYENAELWSALVEVANLESGLKRRKVTVSHYGVYFPDFLKSAAAEIKATGSIPQELKEKILACNPTFRRIWAELEGIVKDNETLARQEAMSLLADSNIPDALRGSADTIRLAAVISLAISHVQRQSERYIEEVANVACDQQLIPQRDVVEKIVRYETFIDRTLNRALDRLERLQRRRRGDRS